MRWGPIAAGLGAFGLGVYAIFFFDPLGRAWVSPDGSVKLEKYFARPWGDYFGNTDFASAGMRVVERSGKVLFDTGLVAEGGADNAVVALPRLFAVSGGRGPHGIAPMLIDTRGLPVRSLSREEFFALADQGQLWPANAEPADVVGLLSTRMEKTGADRNEIARLAAAVPFDSSVPGWGALREKILARDDTRVLYAGYVIGELESADAKKLLAVHFFSHPDRVAAGLDLLRSAEKISEGDRRALTSPWFSTDRADIAFAAIGAWVEAEGAPAPALKLANRFYYGASLDSLDNSYEHPSYFLEAIYNLAGVESADLRKAVLFGLNHPSETFWRQAFYFVRDHRDLRDPAFAAPIERIAAREGKDALLREQAAVVLARLGAPN